MMRAPTESRRIVTIGEVLVEIIASEPGRGFREALDLRGPFPSGAPAIFIDQVAKLGHPAGIISCVGDDDFGTLNIERLRRDGVDVSAISVDPAEVTGSAFVRYRPDGERDFVFNIRRSASARTTLSGPARALIDAAGHLHVMGSSLFCPGLVDATLTAAQQVRASGGTVSFDPNARKEMLADAAMGQAMRAMLGRCDLFMPSGPELMLLSEAASEAHAIEALLEHGITAIVVKRGRDGASYHDRERTCQVAAHAVDEVDPTGAGDCFGATFVTCWLRGMDVETALAYANASGALAIGHRGPMEGTSSFAALDAFLGSRQAGA